jgi:hypothetical protein
MMSLLFGQAFAYEAPCASTGDMDNNSGHVMSHDMDMQMMANTQVMDCCDEDCSCPLGTITSMALTNSACDLDSNTDLQNTSFYSFSIQDTYLPFLHKPPIIG